MQDDAKQAAEDLERAGLKLIDGGNSQAVIEPIQEAETSLRRAKTGKVSLQMQEIGFLIQEVRDVHQRLVVADDKVDLRSIGEELLDISTRTAAVHLVTNKRIDEPGVEPGAKVAMTIKAEKVEVTPDAG